MKKTTLPIGAGMLTCGIGNHVQMAVTFPIRAHAAMRPLARSKSSNQLPWLPNSQGPFVSQVTLERSLKALYSNSDGQL